MSLTSSLCSNMDVQEDGVGEIACASDDIDAQSSGQSTRINGEIATSEHKVNVTDIIAQKRGFNVKNYGYKDVQHVKERGMVCVKFNSKDTCTWGCCKCLPISSARLMNSDVMNLGLVDILNVPLQNRSIPWSCIWPINRLAHYNMDKNADVSIMRDVLVNSRIVKAIQMQMELDGILKNGHSEQAALDADAELGGLYAKRVEDTLIRMGAHVSWTALRLTAWFLFKMFRSLLSSVVVHKGQIHVIKRTCQSSCPVVFLPVHRSHLDYILLTFVLFNFDVRAPYVAAGDNLILPFFGSLMRFLGGFFIRRKMEEERNKRDFIYRAVLHAYVERLLAGGNSIEFFIEGGRSRSGKNLTPKTGLLSVVVDTYLQGVVEDVSIVPVSFSYEKLPEINFTGEQLGLPKKSETFWGTVRHALRFLFGFYGSVRMDFAQPFSLKEFVDNHGKRSSAGGPVTRSPSESFISSKEETDRTLVHNLANHVARDQTRIHSVSSTHLISWALLHVHRDGASMEELVETVETLRAALASRGRGFGFTGLSEDVTRYAVGLLGEGLVQVKKNKNGKELVKPVPKLPAIVELSYYANTVNMVFSLESAVANCIHSVGDMRDVNWCRPDQIVEFDADDVIEESVELLLLLKHEFAFSPVCEDMQTLARSGLASLYNFGIICRPEEEEAEKSRGDQPGWRRRPLNDFPGDDQQVLRDMYGVQMKKLKQFVSMKSVLGPILECYHVVSCHLHSLIGKDAIAESEFIKEIHAHLKKRAQNGEAEYVESACLDTLKNCLASLHDLGVLGRSEPCSPRTIGLAGDFRERAALDRFASRLGTYRS